MDLAPLILSLQVALVAIVLAGVVGIGIAALLGKERLPGRELIDAIFTAPLVLPPTVLGYYLLVPLGRRSFLGHLYESLTGSTIVFTRAGAVCAAAVGALPLVVKFGRSALEGVDPTLVQAARTLGATPLRAFFSVRLPLAAPGVVAAIMLAFARSLGDFGVTLMVAGDIPGETQTASLAIYDAIQAQRDQEAQGMVLVLSAVAIGLVYAVNLLGRRNRGH